jgi:NACalpha-BTF3-like transcription factor
VVQDRLEAALADEQQALQEWEVMDTQLQEAELERATLIAAKTKAKELALEKAQVAESSLEGLKDNYRELRRREERMLREVKEAEASGEQLSADIELQAEKLRRERQMWTERIAAAEEDRRLLFGEAQARAAHPPPALREAREACDSCLEADAAAYCCLMLPDAACSCS